MNITNNKQNSGTNRQAPTSNGKAESAFQDSSSAFDSLWQGLEINKGQDDTAEQCFQPSNYLFFEPFNSDEGMPELEIDVNLPRRSRVSNWASF